MAKPQAEARRFLFEQSFDVVRQPAKKPKPEDEKPPEPTFSAQQLEEARQQGYREGRLAGNEEATSSSEAEITRLITDIVGQLPALSAAQAEVNDRLLHDGAAVVSAIARKILPSLEAQNGLSEVEALLATCLRTLIDQPKITVRVNPQHSASISDHLASAAAASGFDGRFMVEADEAMDPSDCRISWQGGGLERKAEEIWRQIDAAVERYLGTLETTPAPDDAGTDTDAPRSQPPEGDGGESNEGDDAAMAAPTPDRTPEASAPPATPDLEESMEAPAEALDLLEER